MTVHGGVECGACRSGYPYSNRYFQEHVHAYAESAAQYRVTAKGGINLMILTPPDARGIHAPRASASEMSAADRAALVEDLAKLVPTDVAEQAVATYSMNRWMPSTLEALKKAGVTERVVEACARHAHEINRAYCAALGDASQVAWEDAPTWQRESAAAGVRAVLSGAAGTPEQQHEMWMADKSADGWVYGPTKDAGAKTHPCMVPYAELPPEQRTKDYLFRAAVLGMERELTAPAQA